MPRGFPRAARLNELSLGLQPCNFRIGAVAWKSRHADSRWIDESARQCRTTGETRCIVDRISCQNAAVLHLTSKTRFETIPIDWAALLPLTWGVLPQSFVDEC